MDRIYLLAVHTQDTLRSANKLAPRYLDLRFTYPAAEAAAFRPGGTCTALSLLSTSRHVFPFLSIGILTDAGRLCRNLKMLTFSPCCAGPVLLLVPCPRSRLVRPSVQRVDHTIEPCVDESSDVDSCGPQGPVLFTSQTPADGSRFGALQNRAELMPVHICIPQSQSRNVCTHPSIDKIRVIELSNNSILSLQYTGCDTLSRTTHSVRTRAHDWRYARGCVRATGTGTGTCIHRHRRRSCHLPTAGCVVSPLLVPILPPLATRCLCSLRRATPVV